MPLTIGRLAHHSGVNVETIRYYERIGLVRSPPRSAGGHRHYARADLERLAFVRRGREFGFSLDEVRSLLALAERGRSCGEARAITLGHLERIRAKIADLERMAEVLEATAAACAGGSVPDCPIIEVLGGGRQVER
jgi:MerR family transcriptional regulator, mercuric resistance operon regulatory protein